jgi:uncharacterized repeat protein (TIGR01451 family)
MWELCRIGTWGGNRLLRVAAIGFAIAGLAALGLTRTASGVGPAAEALPDLVSDPPDQQRFEVYSDAATGTDRLLLRFNGYVHNAGPGPLEIIGRTPVSGTMSTTGQRIYDTTGAFVREDLTHSPLLIYETADGHNHWHLRAAMRYGLFNDAKSAEVAPAQKVGFCLVDSEHSDAWGPASAAYLLGTFCERNNPTAATVTMGISSGWRDRYASNLAFQWVDVSDVQPGSYWLGAASDPNNAVLESNEGNNGTAFADTPSVVPGFVAQPVSVTGVVPAQTTQVTLATKSFGGVSVDNRRFKIVVAPSHGTLDQPVGTPFAAASVGYTPDPGYSGPDSFTYVALDATSQFPQTPATAAVTLTTSATTASIMISGAPAHLVAGTSLQLTATVVGDPPAVQWRVNGAVGGTLASGFISSTGLYTAPDTPPAGGSVTISASSARASSQVSVVIDPKPVPQPAPDPTPPPTGGGGGGGGGGGVPQPTPAPAPAPSGGGGGGGGAAPDLVLTMTGSTLVGVAGDTIAYHVEVRLKNFTLTAGVTRAIVTDTLPAGLELVSTRVNRGPGCVGTTTLTCNLDFLSGDLVGVIDIVGRITTPGTLVNTASVAAPESDPDPGNNTASVTVGTPAAPSVTTGRPLTPPSVEKALLAAPVLARRGNMLVIGVLPGKAGTLEIGAWKGSRRLGLCRVRMPAGRSVTCQVRIPDGVRVTGIRVVAKLLVGGASVATRQATFSRRLAFYRGTGLECWLSVPAHSAG